MHFVHTFDNIVHNYYYENSMVHLLKRCISYDRAMKICDFSFEVVKIVVNLVTMFCDGWL